MTKKIEAIAKAIQDLEFGEVQITIQDGVIVQINRLEKQRFPQKKNNVLWGDYKSECFSSKLPD